MASQHNRHLILDTDFITILSIPQLKKEISLKLIKIFTLYSKLIKITLICNPPVFHAIIGFLCPHIQNQAYCKKVEIPDRGSDLCAAQKEQKCVHFTLTSIILCFPCTKTVYAQTVPFFSGSVIIYSQITPCRNEIYHHTQERRFQ